MRIGLDMMGGDYAPLEAVKGVKLYFDSHNVPAELVLIGDKPQLDKLVSETGFSGKPWSIVHADEVIDMHDHPTRALKEKKRSSNPLGETLIFFPLILYCFDMYSAFA